MKAKYWISKYALTEGVLEVEADANSANCRYVEPVGRCWSHFEVGKDIHVSHEEALIKAEELRVKKLASLRKSIAKLEAMSFAKD